MYVTTSVYVVTKKKIRNDINFLGINFDYKSYDRNRWIVFY